MSDWIEFVGPNRALALFGIKLVGVNAENGTKLLFSIALVVAILCLGWLLRRLARFFTGDRGARSAFWTRQIITLVSAAIMLIGLASIWFDDPTRLATAMGLISAGLAFALQRAITALAGYFVILRGKTFNVGDRISMGGVRGDVVALGFMQTTIMEMGQPPAVQSADPAMWVKARQYSGRLVTVSNAQIFDEPVYNYRGTSRISGRNSSFPSDIAPTTNAPNRSCSLPHANIRFGSRGWVNRPLPTSNATTPSKRPSSNLASISA